MYPAPRETSVKQACFRLRALLRVAIALCCACNSERGKEDLVSTVTLQPAPAPVERPAPTDSAEPRAEAAEPAAPEPQILAPGANDEFDPAAVADAKQALSALEENAFAPLVHGDKRVLPDSCRAWRSFRSRGFAPKTA